MIALFVIAQNWKQAKYPSTRNELTKCGISKGKQFSNEKECILQLKNATTWKMLKNIMLRKQNAKESISWFHCGMFRIFIEAYKSDQWAGEWELTENGYNETFLGDGNVLKLDYGNYWTIWLFFKHLQWVNIMGSKLYIKKGIKNNTFPEELSCPARAGHNILQIITVSNWLIVFDNFLMII